MKISELIKKLQIMQDIVGNIPVVITTDYMDFDKAKEIRRENIGTKEKPKMVVCIS